MKPEHVEIIIRIMAEADAVLWCEIASYHDMNQQGKRFNCREHYAQQWHKSGLAWQPRTHAPHLTGKQAEFGLNALVREGFVAASRNRSKTANVKLTPKGHELARALVQWPDVRKRAVGFTAKLCLESEDLHEKDGKGRDRWFKVTDRSEKTRAVLLYACGAGWIESCGWSYRHTPAGEKLFQPENEAMLDAAPLTIADAPAHCREIYDQHHEAARVAVHSWIDPHPSDIVCPM